MGIKKLSNNKLIFSGKIFSNFENNFICFQKPDKSDSFISNTIQSEKPIQKTELVTGSNILITGLTLAGIALAYIGTKRLIKKPSKADIELTQFLYNKNNEFSKITQILKENVKNLYEKQLVEFKKLFTVPDSKLPQNIQNMVAEINNAKSVQELFTLENRAVSSIYEWFKNASRQQKPASEFVDSFNKFKSNLNNGIKELQENAIFQLEKPLDIPKNLRKAKHSKQILQKFNDEILNHEKYKVERLSDYADKIIYEDAVALFEKYNNGFDKLIANKTGALKQLIEFVKSVKDKIAVKENSITTKGVKSVLPDSINDNEFFKFITAGEKSKEQWSDFVRNKLGKDLSYKDIELLEKRLMLRNGITASSETVEMFSRGKADLQKVFNILVETNPLKNVDANKITAEQYIDLVDMANSIKNKYGLNSLVQTEMELKGTPRVDSNSLLFKINSAINVYKKQMEMFYKTDRNNYFKWEEIL